MTTSVSSAGAAVLVPVGQPLGKILEPDGAAYYQIRLGADIFRLEMPEAVVWLALHGQRPGTTRGIDRGLLRELDLRERGVADPGPHLEVLLDLGLVIELDHSDPQSRRTFGESYRMLVLQTAVGNSAADPDGYTLTAGAQPTITVDAALLDVLTYSPLHNDLADLSYVRSGPIGTEPEATALADPDALLEYLLGRLPLLLSVNAVYLDSAIDPDAARVAYQASLERPAAVPVSDDDSTPYGLYAVGYQAGARYIWLGLEAVRVRIGYRQHELADEQAWAVWAAAHGVDDGQGVDDSEESICDSAARAGSLSPVHELDSQTERGLVVQPDGDRGLVEFASGHRLEALLAGLGNLADSPGTYYLGIDDDNLITAVPESAYQVWRDAPLSWSLLDAAYAAGRAGSVHELRDYLREVQLLCLRRAAYIDTVRSA